MKFKDMVKLGLFVGLAFWFFTSGTFDTIIDRFSSDSAPTEDSEVATSSDDTGLDLLLAIISEQDALADEINEARKDRDRDGMKRLFSEFEELELQFQASVEEYGQSLTTSELNEVTRKHRQVTRKLN